MSSELTQLIQSRCEPLYPEPTDLPPRLRHIEGIRAVLFDIYGTLMISASGDIGSNSGDHRSRALEEVTEKFGLALNCDAASGIAAFEQQIKQEHAAARESGIAHPEIEIRDVWTSVLNRIVDCDLTSKQVDWAAFSVEYELRVNPTWPMPHVRSTLEGLASRGMVMGIVSNAQFFTLLLFPALLEQTIKEWGFAPNLSYFSYEHRQAKPGSYLYEIAKRDLAETGISAKEVLYVGNDMLNDVAAAASVGFRTALFAGDRRSLRLRSDDERVHGVEADIVVTELPQLFKCLPNTSKRHS